MNIQKRDELACVTYTRRTPSVATYWLF